jgi:anthranilate synthase/aminodeoxychorismate synthase-like glutamine amidotransferase
MLVLIDNYDSFTYNLYQYLCELGADVEVFRNDKITVREIEDRKPERIIISPGPSSPEKAGISNDVVRHFGERMPLLGVCLGHQCIGYSYGGSVSRAARVMHGKSSLIHHANVGVFAGMPNPFSAIRYHSLAVKREGLPSSLEITAWTDDGEIMGIRHKTNRVQGVQFHPESFMTEGGKDILRNFLEG